MPDNERHYILALMLICFKLHVFVLGTPFDFWSMKNIRETGEVCSYGFSPAEGVVGLCFNARRTQCQADN